MAELLILAVASAVYPVLLAVDLVAFRARQPARLLASFLAGGLLATMTVGLAVVYAFQGTSLVSSSNKKTTDHVLGIAVGALALVASLAVARGYRPPRRRRAEPKSVPEGPGWMERMLDRGAALAFVAGIALDIVPGVFPIVALKNVAELDYGFAATFFTLLAFNLILFTLIEIPLVGYVAAPARTVELTGRLNVWLGRNARRLGAAALGVVGLYLLTRGIVGAALSS